MTGNICKNPLLGHWLEIQVTICSSGINSSQITQVTGGRLAAARHTELKAQKNEIILLFPFVSPLSTSTQRFKATFVPGTAENKEVHLSHHQKTYQ